MLIRMELFKLSTTLLMLLVSELVPPIFQFIMWTVNQQPQLL